MGATVAGAEEGERGEQQGEKQTCGTHVSIILSGRANRHGKRRAGRRQRG
jgi:hypothetical protein